jgi:hypothetical protein
MDDMLASRRGLAWVCAAALLSGVAISSSSSVALAAPKGGGKEPAAAAATGDDAKKAEAKKFFDEGKAKADAGDFAGALPLFQKAEETWAGAAPKLRIAQCYDKLGKVREAMAAYRVFIESNPGDKYADRVKESGARLAELEAMLPAKLAVKVTPPDAKGLTITVDGQAMTGTEFETPPGAHTMVVSAEGFAPTTEQLQLKGGEQRDVAVTLAVAQPAGPVAPPPVPGEGEEEEGGSSNIPAYVTLGIAGAGVILGTIFGIQALSAKGDFEDDPTTDNADAAERDALIADMSFGVALTFGITGIVLLFTGGEDEATEEAPAPEQAARPIVVPYASPAGGGVAATWKF